MPPICSGAWPKWVAMIDFRPLPLTGVFELCPTRHVDARGYFVEAYNAERMAKAGIDVTFVQDNLSLSLKRGVVRGLHYQLPPHAQDKLIRVGRGAILDVAVDVRGSSPTFGKWCALVVSSDLGNQLFVPKGCAHGFMTLEDNTEVIYKVSDYYAPAYERSIRYDDPDLGIEWPEQPSHDQLSDKDRTAPSLAVLRGKDEIFA